MFSRWLFGSTIESLAAERRKEGSQGQARSGAECAAPGNGNNRVQALERPTEEIVGKGTNDPASIFAHFQRANLRADLQGLHAPLRFALAPGYPLSRLQRWLIPI